MGVFSLLDFAFMALGVLFAFALIRLAIVAELRPADVFPVLQVAARAWKESARELLGNHLLHRCDNDAERIKATLVERPWLRDMLATEGHWLRLEHPGACELIGND